MVDRYFRDKYQSPVAAKPQEVANSDSHTQTFLTKDGHQWTCRTKGAGGHRMILNEGLFRLMSRERLDHIVHDMVLDAPSYLDFLADFNADPTERLKLPGMDDSMDRLQRVWPLHIFRSASKLESFLLCKDWPSGDWGQWSWYDFQYEGDRYHDWGERADQAGKMALWSNCQMLEATMEVVFDKSMRGSMAAVECVTLRRCTQYSDGFLRFHLKKLVARFFKDVLHNKRSLLFPGQALDTPEGCAALLRLMCEEFAEKTKTVPDTDVIPFETYPHTNFFHPVSGAWFTVANRTARAYTGKPTPLGKGALAPCLYRLCEVADMKDVQGDTIKCRFGTRCAEEHPPLSTTLTDYTARVTVDLWNKFRAPPAQRSLLKTTLALGADFIV